MNRPKISICIPAYKRTVYLKRLLDSILIQAFKDFEVIITDDSPTDEVENLCLEYKDTFPLVYKKNPTPLGTPANWNAAISMAKGEWIKLMHDDDWFSSEQSLSMFADATTGGHKFIFSAYTNVFEASQRKENVSFRGSWGAKIKNAPMILMVQNVIGPPSVTLLHNSITDKYDELMKWRVDIDFYIRVLVKEKNYTYIDKPIINVGISGEQVTNSCLNVPEVELPEGLLLLIKYGTGPLKNIRIYDAWWRVLRNTGVRSVEDLQRYTPYQEWPEVIKKMAIDQSRISATALKNGFISKFYMARSFLKNRKTF